MAFEILSLTKVEREYDYQPNYKVMIRYEEKNIACEIYTNAKFMNGGKIICDYLFRTSFNDNLFLKVETAYSKVLDKILTNELIEFAMNQDKFKNDNN